MAKAILGMTILLDGYINDRKGGVGELCPNLEGLRETEPLQDSIKDTGAVVMGRIALEMADDPDAYAEGYE